MKSVRLTIVLVCFGYSSVGAGQSNNATDTAAPSHRYLREGSACQRNFVTPLLHSSDPIRSVVQEAHAHCLGLEQAPKQALNTEHGPEKE